MPKFIRFFLCILANEFARRTLEGGLITFLLVPILVTVYLFIINICADFGFSWALNNQTHIRMNGWFHYAKLYAVNIGSLGFVLIKHKIWMGKYN